MTVCDKRWYFVDWSDRRAPLLEFVVDCRTVAEAHRVYELELGRTVDTRVVSVSLVDPGRDK